MKKLRSLVLRWKKEFFLFIYDVITWEKIKKALLITTPVKGTSGGQQGDGAEMM